MNKRELKPKEIVKELDRHIIGQSEAKRAIAIAIRNRWRRQRVKGLMREEILPNNLILIGPTGVGKTEIARRIARLVNAPFMKVEASKYTEVGYVGRDVEAMVRDLMNISVNMVKARRQIEVAERARERGEERLLDLLLPGENKEKQKESRDKLRKLLRKGALKDRFVNVPVYVQSFPLIEIFGPMGMEEINTDIQDMMSSIAPKKHKTKRIKVNEAKEILAQEEAQKLVDMEEVISEAKENMENSGIIFIDELDKIVGADGRGGPDVSRAGVQRDLLPIVEGCNVTTKYGMVRTDHILFIAAGAFTSSKPSDLIPELQGRFPIRVELARLKKEDFKRILTEPENALIKQYIALFKTEKVDMSFDEMAIDAIAEYAAKVNETTDDIGARRLHTIMFALMEDWLYKVPKRGIKKVHIEENDVRERLKDIVKNVDIARYIL
ncbi:HslU--HslV peptidase ATPase subunit [candidate division WOR-3 bacterium JGI_Cruoil_03_44_89]|uniref:HslU--HslV peptidase ATPase subunit n=1 Tax=candidate division WOR-3 bacterium JGI_Cruoil_03_44_89 TaxID=1973748 RepID=A0A235BZ40_UNCW3|nr:MAG: HslU--HslV peptidase ATPase subunit [candidate division WOR-3 bacterium JGI_Cruoil_03_44_89]